MFDWVVLHGETEDRQTRHRLLRLDLQLALELKAKGLLPEDASSHCVSAEPSYSYHAPTTLYKAIRISIS